MQISILQYCTESVEKNISSESVNNKIKNSD